jgi:4-hydroxybutyrate dehydrogenase / sulfolactaldehyde 3-reductase
MDRIGFIGLGRMGRPMAANLLKKGFGLLVHDLNPEPVRFLAGLGAKAAGSVAEVVGGSDVVVTMLPSSAEVEATALGPDGLLAHGRAGQLLLDMSTIDPAATERIAGVLAARGIAMVDAPVGRLAAHADRGESLFMVGGAGADVARIRPLLEAMGTTIHHCGPIGAGGKTKLVNNYICVVLCQMNAEALAMAQKLGLDLERTLEVLHGTTATNGQLKINWPNKVLAGDVSPGFTIDLAHKDLSLIMAAAQTAKVPLALGAVSREMLNLARAGNYGQKDFSAILDYLCEIAGIEKPRLKGSQAGTLSAPGRRS